jgi:citrate lyase subunit beta/citryl-CoA lyase
MLARSYLYVPGDAPDKLAKAFDRGADAVVLDLEDAVPAAAKRRARDLVAGCLRERDPAAAGQAFVRVDDLVADIDAVTHASLVGVVVPKATPQRLRLVNDRLDRAESAAGLPPGRVRTIPLVESAEGVLAAPAMARLPRVLRLGLGEVDLMADLGMDLGPDRAELLSIRVGVVVASAAAGLAAPVGPTDPALSTTDGLAASTRRLLSLGFRARTAVHPRQVETINEVFVPTPDEVVAAREALRRFEAMQADGVGVGVVEGHLVDRAMLRSAQETLERWRLAHPDGT